jgi:phage head maturation protease
VPAQFDHTTEVGRFTEFALDEVGVRTTAQYDRTSLADDLLADMQAGHLTA